MLVLGGDGTILRGAEKVITSDTPLLGVNLGHVGFLAEAEAAEIDSIVEHVVNRTYTVEERFTIDVTLRDQGEVIWTSFAVNEVSIEKAARERMLEIAVEIDGLPLSRWACDGVLVATPTGSTAYAFSAGGPVLWPELDALLLVPLSAHALFARPLVLGPTSIITVELIHASPVHGVVWCDGSRSVELRVGMEIEIGRGQHRLRLARLSRSPFTNRLVNKFQLPVDGWRGSAERHRRRSVGGGDGRSGTDRTMITELRITDLGVINDAVLALHPGLTVVTGETGAGKTMIVTSIDLLLGGRGDPKAVRTGARRAVVEGRFAQVSADTVRRVEDAGGVLDDDGPDEPGPELLVARQITPSGRTRAFVGGAQVPVGRIEELVGDLVTVHGQSEQIRLAGRDRQRDLLDRFAGPEQHGTAGELPGLLRRAAHRRRPSGTGCTPRRRSGPGRSTCCGSGWTRSGESTRNRARTWPWRRKPSGCRPAATSASTPTRRSRRSPAPTTRPAERSRPWPWRGRPPTGWPTPTPEPTGCPIGSARSATC